MVIEYDVTMIYYLYRQISCWSRSTVFISYYDNELYSLFSTGQPWDNGTVQAMIYQAV